jgi:predicted nucleic acid-binding protein
MAFVLDASVTMRWLTKDGTIADLAYANFILDKFLEPNMHVHVPSHWPLEITNVMLRSERRGLIDEAASENFLDTLKLAPVMVDLATGARASDDTLAIARYHRLTPYDAAYLELALRLSAPLATLDKDLRRAAEQAGVVLA